MNIQTRDQLLELASYYFTYSQFENLPDWQQKAIYEYFMILRLLSSLK